jgi:tripartite-type tricarboxylate transporter receptor subunit TctC
MKRRTLHQHLVLAAAAPLLAALTPRAGAQTEKAATLVVPYAPGGTTDLLGRLVAQHLTASLGRTVAVENRPGAGSTVGAAHVARAAPDGNTLLVATSSTLAINPALYPKLAYDPPRDFAPVGMIASVPFALVVHASLDARNVAGLIAARRPGGLAYGSAGNGSPQHLAAELFKAATGADLRHVPYGGSAAALTDCLAGRIELMFVDLPLAIAHARDERLRVLGVSSRTAQASLPQVAPIAECGVTALAGFEVVAWQSLVAPAGTPRPIVARINQSLRDWLQRPDTQDKLLRDGIEPRPGSPEQLSAVIREDSARWAKLIKAAGITLS